MNILARISTAAGNTFIIWVLLFTALAMVFPGGFTWIGPYISILLGIIMFGMGLTLSVEDFKAVFKQPFAVFVGVAAQYIIMPGIAYLLAVGLNLPPELAVGVILVGCCPGGTASNVMTYLAKGNIALSLAVSAVATLVSPILTPALIYLLASQWLPVDGKDMLISTIQIVLVPIILGIFFKWLLKDKAEEGAKVLPLVSVIGIVGVISAVVAGNKDQILESGLLMLGVVILHNLVGLVLGFFISKVCKFPYSDQKAIAIEVGMQNSGLAAALATAHFSPLTAVPSAIFSVWHNISGPLVATYWSKKAQKDVQEIKENKKIV
ncbi:bile acid:sodium symporter family protein [Metabacillus sediminilitoris]|jgi:BASS family bile acid:Na+ symporter|uniref:Bile acid:sodium symporter family protein n=1 Tax=Metabacillus sediminilitoris TaxID=2567941 RepID=A0A4S4BUQ8_9BACI|nr:bile acid:sodium symporter family protein [Metabacillus sediminilitoris]QGQ44153.1 bile acid:sodium symporter family protein [Metabacillus sediminilitoris]THF78117.1 bile acid:sodium symporter family protein [Metabacillus sediminilitoris]